MYQHLAHIWNVTSLQEACKLKPEHKTNEEFVAVLVYTQGDFFREMGEGSGGGECGEGSGGGEWGRGVAPLVKILIYACLVIISM